MGLYSPKKVFNIEDLFSLKLNILQIDLLQE